MKIEDNRFKKFTSFNEINVGDLFEYDDCTFLKISETNAFCFEALTVSNISHHATVEPLNAKIVIE